MHVLVDLKIMMNDSFFFFFVSIKVLKGLNETLYRKRSNFYWFS